MVKKMKTQNKVLPTKDTKDVSRSITTIRAVVQEVYKAIRFSSEEGIRKYSAFLASKASGTVITRPTKGKVFRDIEIEGMRFQGYIEYCGPAITNVVPKYNYWKKGCVPLGDVIEIHFCPAFRDHSAFQIEQEAGWWICKYGRGEPLISINSLSEAGRYALAYEFGIPIYPHSENTPNRGFPADWKLPEFVLLPDGDILFYMSPSFIELCNWSQTHPRLVRSSQLAELYLRGWKKAVSMWEFVPNWKGWEGESIKAISQVTE